MNAAAADDLDARIIAQLADDGRRSNRDVARALELPERSVGLRVRRLLASNDMRIVAIVDMLAAGFDCVANVGVRVSGRAPAAVAAELAHFPQVLSVLLMSGTHPIEIVVAARDLAALGQFFERDLYSIAGVTEWSPSLRLRVLKVEAGMAPFTAAPHSSLGFPADSTLDATARGIIELLWAEPRATNQQIATRLGSSETTVRSRIADLRARGVLRITAVNNLRVGDGQAFAAVGIDVEPGRLDDVSRALDGFPEVRFAATVAGRRHILTMLAAATPAQLAALAYDRLAGVPGVARVELAQALHFVKHDYRWSPAVAARAGAVPQRGPTATPHGR